MTTWLVTGGAGYIGSHVTRALLAAGEGVVVLDDLSTGAKDRIPDGVPAEIARVHDRAAVAKVIAEHGVGGVIHVAAKKQVGESVDRPTWYFEENLEGLRTLLDVALEAGVGRFVFSSSAAVYGEVDVELVTEQTPCTPASPYGETKLVGEWMIKDVARAQRLAGKEFAFANLRYFNVAGAGAPELGDPVALNLIPMVFTKLEAGQNPLIFGDDYASPDGTCIRDYIHVADLAEAHVAAALRLNRDAEASLTLNLGTGIGASVKEVIDTILEHTGIDLPPVIVPRRPGDPVKLVASAELAGQEIGWSASRDLRDMIVSAWAGWRFRHDR
ncbi:UDP-glucose 4-epimerase GalE [Actinospica sp. MGRD01-02]|uniref:UDP-glucose 4-epimerase n=1 Tax=Actinospica acidithermotolerans TaxID=2828514 RepID=A0A941ECK0_9ACTN|nr:UDP-glucose 4-epimerase GalE [Actinospica acidithermotolerans]MBR7828128.1 UDP-glucose 4-epimerase GalE [Actinospica acidithermotolerans]